MGRVRSVIVSRLPRPVVKRLRAVKEALGSRNYIDEAEVISILAESIPVPEATLVDVGAHHGLVSALFLRMGWSVIAYEPDPDNRREFEQRAGSEPRLQVSTSAVSDKAAHSVAFYSSPISTGISSLAAFHESHEHSARVEVVTLAADLRAREVERVDFLKVDIEGLDLFALKGFDWSYAPRFVLYEFENRKTIDLGYSLADSAAYVAERGYHLVYSVWEPIVEYGLRHRWRGLFSTPPDDAAVCWGNVLCFREEADAQRCLTIFGSKRSRWLGWRK